MMLAVALSIVGGVVATGLWLAGATEHRTPVISPDA